MPFITASGERKFLVIVSLLSFLVLSLTAALSVQSLISRAALSKAQPPINTSEALVTKCPLVNDTFYAKAIFQPMVKMLNKDYWYANGDWQGDMMYDATSAAPSILYKLGKDCDNQEFLARANKTVEWEIYLVDQVLEAYNEGNLTLARLRAYPALMGFEALFAGRENYQGSLITKQKLQTYTSDGLVALNALILSSTREDLRNLRPSMAISIVQLYANLALADFEMVGLTNDPNWGYRGLVLVEKMEEYFLIQDELGTYFEDIASPLQPHYVSDWEQGVMLSVLASAYLFSGDTHYSQLALATQETTMNRIFDQSEGGFSERSNLPQPKLFLSGNLLVQNGLIRWQAITPTVERSVVIDRVTHFMSSRLYSSGLLYHDWDVVNQSRSGYFCTGCNFLALTNFYKFNLVKNLPVDRISVKPGVNFDPQAFQVFKKQNYLEQLSVDDVLKKLHLYLSTPKLELDFLFENSPSD